MVRKSKYSKEVKIKACIDYDKSNLSFIDIANQIGATKVIVGRWYRAYKKHGPDAFERSNKNRTYSREFKLSVAAEYASGKCSLSDLAAKHNISYEVIRNWVNKWYNGIEIEIMILKGMYILEKPHLKND